MWVPQGKHPHHALLFLFLSGNNGWISGHLLRISGIKSYLDLISDEHQISKKMKRIVLIDDEPDARRTLRKFLTDLCPQVEIAGEADGVENGYFLICQQKPDAVLLDISMKDGTGFDLLDKFPRPNFKVIFTTAFDDFALKAFKYNTLDYLLKPVTPDELVRAVDKIGENHMDEFSMKISNILETARTRRFEKIGLSSQEGLVFLRLDEIVHLEADGNYTTLYLINNERHVVVRPLKEFEDLLPTDQFFRIHQSHIVNVNFVKKYLKEDGGYVLMENGSKVLVARRRKEEFLELLREQSHF